jgi:hypothetical protein
MLKCMISLRPERGFFLWLTSCQEIEKGLFLARVKKKGTYE